VNLFGDVNEAKPYKSLFIRFNSDREFKDFCEKIDMQLTKKMKKVTYRGNQEQ